MGMQWTQGLDVPKDIRTGATASISVEHALVHAVLILDMYEV